MFNKLIWVDIPGTACNLDCSYCYSGGAKGTRGVFPYSLDEMKKFFNPSRFGGEIFFGGASGGETLLCKDIVEFTNMMLEYGHLVSYTTNATFVPVINEFCKMNANCKERLELDASLHYLELKRKNKLNDYFDNVSRLLDAGISTALFLCITQEYISYIQEIGELCKKKVGLLPVASMVRSYNNTGGTNTLNYSGDVIKKLREYCNFNQWDLQQQIYGVKRNEFCYAGLKTINLSMTSGYYRKCWNSPVIGNFYDLQKTLNFSPIERCPFNDCVCASYLCWGLVPSVNTPTHSITYFDKDKVSSFVWNSMNRKLFA